MLDTPRIAASDDTRGAKGGPVRLRRAPLAVSALAALAAAGMFWSGGDVPPAHAEANAPATIDTPYGRAPLSFGCFQGGTSPRGSQGLYGGLT